MRHDFPIILVIFAGLTLPAALRAQSDDQSTPLGDIARALRRDKEEKDKPEAPSARTVIDNDNLSQVVDQAAKDRLKNKMTFLFDGVEKGVHVAAPDVTCSLSFSAKTGALVADPFVAQDLPRNEISKLDGPAAIDAGKLEVTVYNGTGWNLREITVGLTIVRQAGTDSAANYGQAKLLPASAVNRETAEKRSDLTVLYHIQGSAAPFSTTVFRQDLGGKLSPDQEWHWAIVQAQGIPPK
jgi:hypothetical protein